MGELAYRASCLGGVPCTISQGSLPSWLQPALSFFMRRASCCSLPQQRARHKDDVLACAQCSGHRAEWHYTRAHGCVHGPMCRAPDCEIVPLSDERGRPMFVREWREQWPPTFVRLRVRGYAAA